MRLLQRFVTHRVTVTNKESCKDSSVRVRDVMLNGKMLPIFRRSLLPPCSGCVQSRSVADCDLMGHKATLQTANDMNQFVLRTGTYRTVRCHILCLECNKQQTATERKGTRSLYNLRT